MQRKEIKTSSISDTEAKKLKTKQNKNQKFITKIFEQLDNITRHLKTLELMK
jgi:hypothetical protein